MKNDVLLDIKFCRVSILNTLYRAKYRCNCFTSSYCSNLTYFYCLRHDKISQTYAKKRENINVRNAVTLFFLKVCVSISLSLSVCVFESLRFFVFNSSVRSPSYENIHAGTFHAITSVSKLKYVFLAQTMKSKLLCLVS